MSISTVRGVKYWWILRWKHIKREILHKKWFFNQIRKFVRFLSSQLRAKPRKYCNVKLWFFELCNWWCMWLRRQICVWRNFLNYFKFFWIFQFFHFLKFLNFFKFIWDFKYFYSKFYSFKKIIWFTISRLLQKIVQNHRMTVHSIPKQHNAHIIHISPNICNSSLINKTW
jgi:hypothetical protein